MSTLLRLAIIQDQFQRLFANKNVYVNWVSLQMGYLKKASFFVQHFLGIDSRIVFCLLPLGTWPTSASPALPVGFTVQFHSSQRHQTCLQVFLCVILRNYIGETKGRRDYQSRPIRDHPVIEIYLTANIFMKVSIFL